MPSVYRDLSNTLSRIRGEVEEDAEDYLPENEMTEDELAYEEDEDVSDSNEDDGEDKEGDYAAMGRPYNPESDADFKFPFPGCKRIKLNIDAFYTRQWGGREAFREFYQSWMDGILESSDLELDQFKLDYYEETTKRQGRIEITCRHPTKFDPDGPTVKKLLRYTLFRWPLKHRLFKKGPMVEDTNQEGWVEMCNFKASLTARNFTLGNTTKANKKGQAGEHGEGFKLEIGLSVGSRSRTYLTSLYIYCMS